MDTGNRIDAETAEQITTLERALQVLVLTPHIRTYLEQHDPKALEQAVDALGPAANASIELAAIQGLLTTCEAGHTVLVPPASIRDGEAIFGSAADFCDYTHKDKRRCERTIVHSEPKYA